MKTMILSLLMVATLYSSVRGMSCKDAREIQRSASDNNAPGYYEYECLETDETQYKAKQCWQSTGRCWCVDQWGGTIPGSESNPGAPPIDCNTFGWCTSTLNQLLIVDGKKKIPPLGMYVPKCDANGKYSKQQCHGSTGQCWCTVESGEEVQGTRTLPGATHMDCDNLPPCLKEEESLSHLRRDDIFPIGLNRPECTPDGLYLDRQCHASTGYCWCTDPKTGKEIDGTLKGPSDGQVECGTKPELKALSNSSTPCQRLKHSQTTELNAGDFPLLGYFVISCEDDGSFSEQQCHPSTGHCWCVEEDGMEILGSMTAPGVPRTPCGARPKTCKEKAIVEDNRTERMKMVGMYSPQCKEDGSYHGKQCWGSTGQCWCVTEEGKEVPYTKRGPGYTNELSCDGNISPELVKSIMMISSKQGDDPEGADPNLAQASIDQKKKSEDWKSERTTLIAVLTVFGCLLVIVVVAMGIYFTKKRNEGSGSPRYSAVKEGAEAI